MSKLCIAHLSDLHVLKNYRGSWLQEEIKLRIMPDSYAQIGLEEAAKEHPDVIVLTGDMVHEGTEDDYRYLKEMLHGIVGEIPVVYVLGNHDRKRAFYRGILDTDDAGPYCSVTECKGYRLVTLDTSVEDDGNGVIDAAQTEWLGSVLSEPSANGTILLGHHPLVSASPWYTMTTDARLEEILLGSDAIAYLCGHTHLGEVRRVMGMVQSTAESFAFGVEMEDGLEIYTESKGYSMCRIEGKEVIVHPKQVYPCRKRVYPR